MKAQLLRFQQICTDRVEAVKILVKALRDRGYLQHFLRMTIKGERSMRGVGVQTSKKKVLPFIVKFSRTAQGLATGLREALKG